MLHYISASKEIRNQLSILTWTKPDEVEQYFEQCRQQVQKLLEDDEKLDAWKHHHLYKDNTKEDLQKICQQYKIPVTAAVNKLQLVQLIAQQTGEAALPTTSKKYSGLLRAIPVSVSAINKLTTSKLREILNYHKLPILGSKDRLVMRVFLLRNGENAAIIAREQKQLIDLIRVCKLLIIAQKKANLQHQTYKRRKYLADKSSHFISPPSNITVSNLSQLFEPLLKVLQSESKNGKSAEILDAKETDAVEDEEELMSQVGAIVKVKWGKDELGDSGWKPGWYLATVQSYNKDNDLLDLTYTSEPGCSYTVKLGDLLEQKKIKLHTAVI